jgi:hypothetical protein
MDAKLKKRALALLPLRNSNKGFSPAEIAEVAAVHHALTARIIPCTTCNIYGLLNEINSFIYSEPLTLTNMAAKGQFKHNAASTQIIRHEKNSTFSITPENLNEGDNFIYAAKHYPHLVEEIKKEEVKESKESAKTAKK